MDASVGLQQTTESKINRILKWICGLLILLVISQEVLMLAGIPSYYQRVTRETVPTLVTAGEERVSNALVAGWAAERGMDLPAYALYTIVLNLVITVVCASIAALILWKARRAWFYWFTALVLLFIPSGGLWEFTMVSRIAYHYIAISGLLWPAFLLFMYLFPIGRVVPRWTGWVMGTVATLHLLFQSIGLAAEFGFPFDRPMVEAQRFFPIVVTTGMLVILFSQVYRYIFVINNVERAQVKWFVVGISSWLAINTVIDMVTQIGSDAVLTESGIGGDLSELLMLIIPVSIGIGILRYRLFDIDLIIRRTLVYGLLTASLALLYFGCVLVIQQVLTVLTRTAGQSPVVIVISTLVIAGLFAPLRRSIQQFVDRRFYRERYNAEETIQSFSIIARGEVNLEQLQDNLLMTVQRTFQPEHASLWLRDVSPQGNKKAASGDTASLSLHSINRV